MGKTGTTKDDSGPNETQAGDSSYSAPAADRALDIIEYLSASKMPQSRSEIARGIGRSPSEIFRHLNVLQRRGYIMKDEATGAYELTLRIFMLSQMHAPFEKLLVAARGPMRRLSSLTSEACHLSVLNGDRILVIAQEHGRRLFRASVEVGSPHPIAGTTSGRILLACWDPEKRQSLIDDLGIYADLSPRQIESFTTRLDSIAKSGVEITVGEWITGATDIGTAIKGANGDAIAALVLTSLQPSPPLAEFEEKLKTCATEIERRLGLN